MHVIRQVQKSLSLGLSVVLLAGAIAITDTSTATALGKENKAAQQSQSSNNFSPGSISTEEIKDQQHQVDVLPKADTDITRSISNESVSNTVYSTLKNSEKITLNRLAEVERIQAQKQILPEHAKKELVEKRTSTSKHYLLGDGKYEAVFSLSQQHFQDDNGQWQDAIPFLIDENDVHLYTGKVNRDASREIKSLKASSLLRGQRGGSSETGFYRAPQVPFDSKLPKRFTDGYSIEKDGSKLTFFPQAAASVTGEVYGIDQVRYKDAWNATDVQLTVTNDGLKEDIIVYNSEAPTQFTYAIQGGVDENLRAGSLSIAPMWLMDANGKMRNVDHTLRTVGSLQYLDIHYDPTGLSYPLTIDPTVTIAPDANGGKDSFVSKSQPNTNYGSSTYIIASQFTQATNQIYRGLVEFNLSSIPTQSTVKSAKMNLYVNGLNGGYTTVSYYRVTSPWNEQEVTWNNKPSFSEEAIYGSFKIVDSSTGWHSSPIVTSLVQEWVSNPSTNNGLYIRGPEYAGGCCSNEALYFASSDNSNGVYGPRITIEYDGPPTAPTITTPTAGQKWDGAHMITWMPSIDGDTPQSSLKYQIQLSLDGGNIWSDIITMTSPGITSYPYDFSSVAETANAIIRIRGYDGVIYSDWGQSTPFAITHNHAPNAPTNLMPGSGSPSTPTVVAGVTPSLQWTFTDPDSGNTQSAYNVMIYNTSNTLLHNSGWFSSSNNSYSVPTNILVQGTTYYWKVRTKDNKGAESPFSANMYIRPNTLPLTAITSYTDGQTLTDNILTFTWSYNDSEGQSQTHYQLVGSKDNWSSWAYNSGEIASPNKTITTPALSEGTWSFAVRVRDGAEWSNWAFRNNLKLPNAYEPNDTSATATPITKGSPYSSAISSVTDVDWYKYTAAANGIDQVVLSMPSDKNYDVYIYDQNLKLVGSGIRSGNGEAEEVIYKVTGGKIYYLKVVGAGGQFSTASYSFTASTLQLKTDTTYQYDGNGNMTSKSSVVNP